MDRKGAGGRGRIRAAGGAWGFVLQALAAVAVASAAAPARAEWTEVSSEHFVIYGDQKPETLRRFSERLELYHAAMAHLFERPATKTSPSNRVSVYVVPDAKDVRELVESRQRFMTAVYRPMAGNSFAIVPTLNFVKSPYGNQSEIALFHEYAHHFMYGLTSRTYPKWFVEGFAEFFATVEFKDDTVGLGVPARHRALELEYAREVPIRQMLDYDGGLKDDDKHYNAFYGQSWALFHYLVFRRANELSTYQQLLAQGQTALQAAEGAFGDLDELAKDLDRYTQSRQMQYLPIPRSQLRVGPINVRTLPEGEAAAMPTKIRSRTGVHDEEAAQVVAQARTWAAKYPSDSAVLTELAEAEVDTGNFDAAINAADRALALDPKQMNAWVQKGYALTAKAKANGAPKEAWAEVRSHWIKANKVENDNPIPLAMYYETFLEQGVAPTPNAVKGLEWALVLAPFDGDLRWAVAQRMISDGRLAQAATTLGPLAFSPHPGENTEAARKLLAEVESRIAAQKTQAATVSSAN